MLLGSRQGKNLWPCWSISPGSRLNRLQPRKGNFIDCFLYVIQTHKGLKTRMLFIRTKHNMQIFMQIVWDFLLLLLPQWLLLLFLDKHWRRFKGDTFENVWKTWWSPYGHFWENGYHLEHNWTELWRPGRGRTGGSWMLFNNKGGSMFRAHVI